MCATLAHRGPDDAGVWASADGGVALSHRRLSIIDLSPLGRLGFALIVAALYAFLLLPLLIVVFTSFSPDERNVYALSQASLRWYREFFGDARWTIALANSLAVAALTMAISFPIGLLAALALARPLRRAQAFAAALILMPLFVPAVVLGIGSLALDQSISSFAKKTIAINFNTNNPIRICGQPRIAKMSTRKSTFDFKLSKGVIELPIEFVSGPQTTTMTTQIKSAEIARDACGLGWCCLHWHVSGDARPGHQRKCRCQ